MTPTEALARIAALCDGAPADMSGQGMLFYVRAVLAETGVTTLGELAEAERGMNRAERAEYEERIGLREATRDPGGVLDRDRAAEIIAAVPADQPLLALWVHVDLDGRASFGGRMNAADTVTTLRFLADQVEAGDVKLGTE